MNKLKNNLAFHKTGVKILKLIHSIDSSAIPLTMINSLFLAATPYISMIFLAFIIDELMIGSYKKAMYYVACLVIANLFVGILSVYLKYLFGIKRFNINLKHSILLRKKAFELDYAVMEDKDALEKINFSERTAAMFGGFGQVLDYYGKLFSALLSILTSTVLVLQMCFSSNTHGNGTEYGVLSFISFWPVTFLLLVIVQVISLKISAHFMNKYSKEKKSIFQDHTGIENTLGYFMNSVLFSSNAGKVSRLYHMKDMILENYLGFRKISNSHYKKGGDIGRKIDFVESCLNIVTYLFSYFVVAAKVLTHAITVGAFTKYVGALTQFGISLGEFININEKISWNCSYLQVFLDFLDLQNQLPKGSIPVEKREDNEFEIEFINVSFAYPGSSEYILKNVNCKLTLKHKMAVVGCNGAGKTTFIKLLCRLYDPTEGVITLNGIDIRKYNQEEYRKLFGVVFQDFQLLSFPIGENVAAGEEYDRNKVKNCLKKAGVLEVVNGLPKGLNTTLFQYDKESVNLSGGELQKLAIARALYKDAPFVILDEPTAALDPISEYEIYSHFDELVQDKTSIYISHRMSSCRFCDDIIVFDHGQIVERGSHEELLFHEGQYHKLWNAQAQYYEEG